MREALHGLVVTAIGAVPAANGVPATGDKAPVFELSVYADTPPPWLAT
jgi:hypothetical protein